MDDWDATFEVRLIKGNKITIPKHVVDRLNLQPKDYLRVGIKKLVSVDH